MPVGRPDAVLAHERRRRLHGFIVGNPGTHFRAAIRGVGLPAGAGRHHVNRLADAGLIVVRRSGPHMLLFENHARYEGDWRLMAALRDENSRRLLEWLASRPDSVQRAVLDAFAAEHGWNRSTTQKRLDRLRWAGLVETRSHGRYKLYRLTCGPSLQGSSQGPGHRTAKAPSAAPGGRSTTT